MKLRRVLLAGAAIVAALGNSKIIAAPLNAQELTIAAIRISFQPDQDPATAGNGLFVLSPDSLPGCSERRLDPPPHDKEYFKDHLRAAAFYWSKVSRGNVTIDTLHLAIFPPGDTAAYQLAHPMSYYHPYMDLGDTLSHLVELIQEAVNLADADVDFSAFNTFIFFHAGLGGDFAFVLDPTPGNIPSTYLSQSDLEAYGGIATDEGPLTNAILLPETQNFLQFAETRTLFNPQPCNYQFALNGTVALLLGFRIGLTPLYDLYTGRSHGGRFALMDQGSNNAHGLVPAPPMAYNRIQAGWEEPQVANIGDSVSLDIDGPPVKIPIGPAEYYLIENRQRNLEQPIGWETWVDSITSDTFSVQLSPRGVVLQVDEQTAGLPGNGLLIWHIAEFARGPDDNPNGLEPYLISLVEADGAPDIGYQSRILFADFLETGWWFDPWFAGNQGWFDLNRIEPVIGDSLLRFTSTTHPATISKRDYPTYLRVENISAPGRTMHFRVGSDRVVPFPEGAELIGIGSDSTGEPLVWLDDGQVYLVGYSLTSDTLKPIVQFSRRRVFSSPSDSLIGFSDPIFVIFNGRGNAFYNYLTDTHIEDTTGGPVKQIIRTEDSLAYLVSKNQSSTIFTIPVDLSAPPTAQVTIPLEVERFYRFDPDWAWATSDSLYTPVSHPYAISGDVYQPVEVFEMQPSSMHRTPVGWLYVDEDNQLVFRAIGDTIKVLRTAFTGTFLPFDIPTEQGLEGIFFTTGYGEVISSSGLAYYGSPFVLDGEPLARPVIVSAFDAPIAFFFPYEDGYGVYDLQGKRLERTILPESPAIKDVFYSNRETLIASEFYLLRLPLESESSINPNFAINSLRERAAWWSDSSLTHEVALIEPGSGFIYPNPIRGKTATVRVHLGAVTSWRIRIFTTAGNEVIDVAPVPVSSHAVNEWRWDVSNLSNGLYLIQLEAEGNGKKEQVLIKAAVVR